METGIVICSRANSSRIPRKAFALVNGIPLLEHLITRLIPTGLKIVIAVPDDELSEFKAVFGHLKVFFFSGYGSDPLLRMWAAADAMQFDTVIRVNHDKVFVQPKDIKRCLEIFSHSTLDYIYSSSFVPGSGFEVISYNSLEAAANKYENVEHVSYAIHEITDRKTDVPMGGGACEHRLLMDYPEDMFVLNRVMKGCGNGCSLENALAWLDAHPDVSMVNRLPKVTVYTCAYNSDAWVKECMDSVATQNGFKDFEYLLIDDASKDFTGDIMKKFSMDYRNVSYHRNERNKGLASSANIALSRSRGKFIIRLDADDYLTGVDVLQMMVARMEIPDAHVDACYPDHFLGTEAKIQKGSVDHHAGGAMFSTKALNHLKFTDGLRGYDSFDLYERAKTQLSIGYFHAPTFFYRQHDASLTKSDPTERAEIKREILTRIHGSET